MSSNTRSIRPDRRQELKWQLAGIGINAALYLLLLFFFNNGAPKLWFNNSGDGPDYIRYATHLLNEGTFTNGGSFFSRMPMYPAIIALLLSVLGTTAALTVLVWMQVLLSGYTTWVAGKICEYCCGHRSGFFIGFVLYACFPLLRAFDFYILTESFATSLFVISAWMMVRWYAEPERVTTKRLLLLGTVLVVLLGLRPYMGLWIAAVMAALFIMTVRHSGETRLAFRYVLLLSLPLLLFEGWWITRNYLISDGRIIALQEGVYAGAGSRQDAADPQTAYVAVWRWANAVGEDVVFWNPGTFGAWMFRKGPFVTDTYDLPPRVLCSAYTADDLRYARGQYVRMDTTTDDAVRAALADTITSQFNAFTREYINERPYDYHLTNRLRILRHALVHSGPVLPVQPWPAIKAHPVQLAVKLWAVVSYWLVLLAGMAWALFTVFTIRRRTFAEGLLSAFTLLLFIFLCFYLRMTEFRIYQLVFPALVLFTAKVLYLGYHILLNRFHGKRTPAG